jgi:hypothetical protein
MKHARFIAVALLSIAGCASHAPTKPVAAAAPAVNYPVITRLVGRHQTVTISAGPGSALYSVQSPDGKMLIAFATLEELRTKHPEQYRFLQPVVALETSMADVASR